MEYFQHETITNKATEKHSPRVLSALTFLACHGQVQPGNHAFSLCSEPSGHRAARIWWPQATWVSSCASKWSLGQSWFMLPLAVNANNTITVPSVPALVYHFGQYKCGNATECSFVNLGCLILCHLKLVFPGSQPYLIAFWLPLSLPERRGSQQRPHLLPLKPQCYSRNITQALQHSRARAMHCPVPEVNSVC